jgi:hypothetical protein
MRKGMLWFDNDSKRTISEKITKAVIYYHNKYGRNPDCCHVHPSMLPSNAPQSKNLKILPDRTIMPNYFWIGISS